MNVVAEYEHPQGSTIYLYDNGAIVKKNPAGKTVNTSATAEKLAAGHGGWRLRTGSASSAAPAAPASKAAPAVILQPMRFKEAKVADVAAYTSDDAWVMQQKLDGVRAQLVFEPGKDPWFRNSSGGRLAAAAAIAYTDPIAAHFGTHPVDNVGFCVDGEVVNGTFWAFDLVVDGGEKVPFEDRLEALRVFCEQVKVQGWTDIQMLPAAVTTQQKEKLAVTAYDQGGEGWIAKRRDSTYDWGQRVTHSLKLKITHTIDCVVLDRNRDREQNMVLGAWDEHGNLVEIGCASAIGKPDAKVGAVVEVKYLYAGANGRLTQPTVLRIREDKLFTDCSTDQLRFANKDVQLDV